MPRLTSESIQRRTPRPDPTFFDVRFVPPRGPADSPRLYFVGEAPGKDEADQRKPFVGQAGKTLNRLMTAAGIDLSEVRFFNAVPFRPVTKDEDGAERNRTPTKSEIRQYSAVLFEDIRISNPKVIVASGKSAMAAFGIQSSIEVAREREYEFDGTPVLATYHPQYIVYSGGEGGHKARQMVEDLRMSWRRSA